MEVEKLVELYEETFAKHKATLVQNTERYLIIDWRREDKEDEWYTKFLDLDYVNYIIDKECGSLIVTGKLGFSVASWRCPMEPSDIKNYIKNDIEHYISMIECASHLYYRTDETTALEFENKLTSRYHFNDIITAYEDCFPKRAENEIDMWINIECEIARCVHGDAFVPSESIINLCEMLCPDYKKWLYDCGKRIHKQVYLWAEGFYRACNQLGI